MLDVHRAPPSSDGGPSPECHDPIKKPHASPSTKRFVSEKTPITPATADSTVAASPTSSVRSTPSADGALSQGSQSSSNRSTRLARFTLPSPSRSCLDPQYAARLGSQMREQRQPQSTSIMPPPYIARGTTSSSIFRPTTGNSQGLRGDTSSGSGSLHSTPNGSFRSTYTSPSLQGSASFVSSFGSMTSPIDTPRRYSTQYQRHPHVGRSDRYIPSRATSSLSFSLWGERPRRQSSNIPSPTDSDDSSSDDRNGTADDGADASTTHTAAPTSSQQPLLNELLRSELLGENMDPITTSNLARHGGGGYPRNPLRESGNNFRFQSPRQVELDNVYDARTGPESIISSFSLNPMGSETSHRLLSAPQKRPRRIQKVPFKVLDAPALQDDFYLNLVDWYANYDVFFSQVCLILSITHEALFFHLQVLPKCFGGWAWFMRLPLECMYFESH